MSNEAINRVAGLTIFFWIVKIFSTTVGETAADYVAVDLNIGLLGTTLIMGFVTIIAIFLNFNMKKYFAPTYWFLIVMMSIEGTLITDILVDRFNISLISLDIVFTIAMILGFIFWYKEEGTLSIHKITNRRREVFYWLIVLTTFALGTAVGDSVSEHLNFGYSNSLMLFGAIFILSGVLFYSKVLGAVPAFWIAFIVTRPIGASLGDLFIQAPQDGGMGIAASNINIAFFSIILVVVAHLTATKCDITEKIKRVSNK